ncbi:MAG TPA: glycosyltransferase [Candidatus Acidoferrum sp.]|jgi:glycosyltransferase involved in cell wall biosynthesis
MTAPASITAIVPARNEEAVVAACIESLSTQPEIAEIIAVNDQSSDRTSEILHELARKIAGLRVVDAPEPPPDWVGKNHAVSLGAQQAVTPWLLFTDADAVLLEGAAAKAITLSGEHNAALVSFSPEQDLETWYEKALIPFVYLRLAQRFPFDQINDPSSSAAAANGQFLLIKREAYDAVGGHAAVRGAVLEDVALARRVKAAGFRIWFAAGAGMVRVRMYRSFSAMWEGWKKNLFQLMGGTTGGVFAEFESAFPWMILVIFLIGIKMPVALFAGVILLLLRQLSYGLALSRNHFPFKFIIYYIPAVFLYAGVLWASHESYAKGKVSWKDREYSVGATGASK